MKKLSAIAIAAAVLLSFVPAAAEPAVLLSLAAPSAMLSSAVPGSYDLDELDDPGFRILPLGCSFRELCKDGERCDGCHDDRRGVR